MGPPRMIREPKRRATRRGGVVWLALDREATIATFSARAREFEATPMISPATVATPAARTRRDGHASHAGAAARPAGRGPPCAVRRRSHMSELATEAGRIERLASIREVVFGAQDGLVSTFAVVAGLAAAGVGNLVVLLGGAVSAVAGVLSMSIGTYLSSRAQRQLYETELARERREIHEHMGEEIAELIAALHARGMPRADAAEVARRIARHPDILLSALHFEIVLAPRGWAAVRDAS